jgi:hypothetical protein
VRAAAAGAVLLLPLATAGAAPPTFDGAGGQTALAPPRLEAEVEVDGSLDEPAWAEAARLTGFSLYAPTDGVPAEETTEVLVFYSPTAIHFGVRAAAAEGSVRATLAQRDRLQTEDRVEVFLSTFNDAREALYFAFNPLGVQADGVLVEGAAGRTGAFGELATGRQEPDLAPDYVFDSKGRLTAEGYEVEVRIPFKSLRFSSAEEQSWRLHVTRRREATGREDSWVPAKRASASFLGQAGTLTGLRDLRRGLVLDVTPEVTSSVNGAAEGDDWGYDAERPQPGVTARWGVTSDLTLTGTANPDFSQVEADANELSFDPRSAVFIGEKRPFFLDGIEQLQTPNRLIYTRRIVDPLAAVKLTGKVSGTSLALVTALDDEATSRSGLDRPWFGLLRVQRDLGAESRAAFVYTDRETGQDFNRVAAADARLTFGKLWSLNLQGGWSHTRRGEETLSGPIWDAILNRNGRRFGLRYQAVSLGEEFVTEAGFIGRPRISRINLDHRVTFFGPPGGFLERVSSDVVLDGLWRSREFLDQGPLERKLHLNNNAVLRGGWRAGLAVLIERFDYDDDLYADYALQDAAGTLLPFVGTPYIHNLDWVLSWGTPQFEHVSASGYWLFGRDENFYEWSPADIHILDATVDVRPTERLRFEARYQLQKYDRRTDGTTVGVRHLPRLKVEYQVTRWIAARVTGEWDANEQDDLRDDSRTELPIVIRDGTGTYRPARGYQDRRLRLDALLSYQPRPGTVVFVGYGSRLEDPQVDDLRGRDQGLRREQDGFFVKLSYLFRL